MFNVNINKNNSLEALQQLVEQNFSKKLEYLPDSFNEKQQEALELFRKRIFLEKTIEEAVSFNKKVEFPTENKNLSIVSSAEDLIDVFKLRSDVYTQLNYQGEFPDMIEGLNFDHYDSNSAIIFYRSNNIVTGTTRVIYDSEKKLPTESKCSYDHHRKENLKVCELSRLIISNEKKGLNLEFKNLTSGVYHLFDNNDIDLIVSIIKQDHFKLYSKFGGFSAEISLPYYGHLNYPFYITSWDPSQISPFFKKAFLN